MNKAESRITIVALSDDGELRASTDVIADGMHQQHASVIKLVRRHQLRLNAMGRVGFEIQPFETNGGIQNREVASLNERQAAFLISLMKNSAKVVEFKFDLINEFYRMREALQNRDMNIWERRLRFESKDEASRSLGSRGSRLMHTRRKEIPPLKAERAAIVNDMERPLFSH